MRVKPTLAQGHESSLGTLKYQPQRNAQEQHGNERGLHIRSRQAQQYRLEMDMLQSLICSPGFFVANCLPCLYWQLGEVGPFVNEREPSRPGFAC